MFITVDHEAESEVIVQKSRFIAHVKGASSKDEAEAYIDGIRAAYGDATHNVPAYVIGEKQELSWSSEDGEPQGTSGAPVLRMIMQEGLTNVVIVITRYFGGVKLGTGGLVRAYTDVAKAALEEAGRKSCEEESVITVTTDYAAYDRIKSRAFDVPVKIEGEDFGAQVSFSLTCRETDLEMIEETLTDIASGKIKILKTEKE